MAHMIDMSNNRANVAFLGSRKDVWHKLGQEMTDGMNVAQWAQAAGLDWDALMVPAIADLSGPEFDHLPEAARLAVVEGRKHIVRSDTGHQLGYSSDGYQPVQPRELLEWFQHYISEDDRFKLDVAGSLKSGEIVWATATFNGPITVGGDAHVARLLMTTTFDLSGSTINQATMTRTVCRNTLNVALSDNRAVIRTRHNTKFNADKTRRELAQLAESIDSYKAMGDAMASTHMSKDVVAKYFKRLLDIPFDAKQDDVSTRKLNQFSELNSAYRATLAEGTEPETAWTALNAVTRYVDHDRSTRGGTDKTESRFLSAQFGSGAQMKAHAVELLTADDDFKALIAATPFKPARMDDDGDIKSLLARPFRSSRTM